jgi:hypothetical protein
MTQDEIIDMAEICSVKAKNQSEFIELFAKLIAQNEREACAKLFDERDKDIGWYDPGEPAEIIRAMKQ